MTLRTAFASPVEARCLRGAIMRSMGQHALHCTRPWSCRPVPDRRMHDLAPEGKDVGLLLAKLHDVPLAVWMSSIKAWNCFSFCCSRSCMTLTWACATSLAASAASLAAATSFMYARLAPGLLSSKRCSSALSVASVLVAIAAQGTVGALRKLDVLTLCTNQHGWGKQLKILRARSAGGKRGCFAPRAGIPRCARGAERPETLGRKQPVERPNAASPMPNAASPMPNAASPMPMQRAAHAHHLLIMMACIEVHLVKQQRQAIHDLHMRDCNSCFSMVVSTNREEPCKFQQGPTHLVNGDSGEVPAKNKGIR